MTKVSKLKLEIEGMHCTSCAMSIDMDLEDIDGVMLANTNYARQDCEVEFDKEKVNLEKIIKTIQNTGYEARAKGDL